MKTATENAGTPFHVLAKPIGPICNLDCEYCFYLKKKDLFPETTSFAMSQEVLDAFTRQYIEAQPPGTPEVNFAWQGGEPTLLGIPFFQRAVELQGKYAREGLRTTNSFQTNGTLLDDAWGAFLGEHEFLVGISIDGPEDLHDRYRRDRKGGPTLDKVLNGLETLKRFKVEFNTLTVVQSANGDCPERVYDFLEAAGSTFFQFIPIVETLEDGTISGRSVGGAQYGRFLNGIFERWLERGDVGRIFVQDFDMLLGLVMGLPSSVCVHGETCGRAVAIEHNGDLFSCDHFVTHGDRLGNVLESTLAHLLDAPKQQGFGQDKKDALPRYCRECDFLRLCNGGCPKDRHLETPDGEGGLNYLCEGYRSFYRHTTPVLEQMAACLRLKRPASDYKQADALVREEEARHRRAVPTTPPPPGKVGPNEPCPCGSGRKFKKCCLHASA